MAEQKKYRVKEELKGIKDLKMDLITFEVLRNAFVAASYEGSLAVEEFAYHPVVGMGRDRSNGLLTANGDMVSHGHTDAAAHYSSFEFSVKEFLKDWPKEKLEPGDAFLFSDPYRTGSHVNDTRLIKPIFFKDRLVAFGCTVIHWPDMGGPNPGTFNPKATTCYAEGIRIPPIKLYRNNELDEQWFGFIALNIRGAIERRGDLTAQFGAVSLIESRTQELCEKYGADTVELAFEEQFNYSERVLYSYFDEIPDGEWEFEDFGDRDVMKEGEPPVRVHCKLTKKGRRVTFDWSNSDPMTIGSWGCPRYTTCGANLLGVMITFPDIFPMNHGIVRNIEIITKPGTCIHVVEPGPTTGYCSGGWDKVEQVSVACLSQMVAPVLPWRVYPGSNSLTNCCIGGYNPRTGKNFVHYWYGVGGENARVFKDGKSFIFPRFANASTVPGELEERWFPVLFTKYEAVVDSCGHGIQRGGFALERDIEMLADAELTIHGDREVFTPYGIGGGTNGGHGFLILNKGTKEEKNMGMYATGIKVKKGDRIYFGQSGGGAFGNPRERDPEGVLEDVMDEWLTIDTAKKFYGVIINEIDPIACKYEIDWEATKELREELKKKPLPEGPHAHQVHPMGKNIKPDWIPTEEEVQPHITVSRPPGW